ncbi:IclR family transcriptional regulator [Noviherbaspirillum suwonense]|uniref:Transcriptional regulator, IclR family n=1 Tax=Noviherbaspirillum suwonense TaxID=1224511 RepID=A0ABY1QC67_9BURK|nr:IclR family transcriptional regulator [Noviherbaspirillum suwonense]SMP67103.1 transcriptional regulator, IclR family [Noviherbaspirillum suwonense]
MKHSQAKSSKTSDATAEAEPGVAAVNRALTILQAFEQSIDGMTLTELMNATGLYHSTILRLCESLEHFGYLKRLADGRYMLGPTPFFLGMLYQESFRLQEYVLPVLRELVRQTEETAALYVREGDERVCLHRLHHVRSVRMNLREGERVPLDRGAAGKVLLAFSGQPGENFNRIRTAGYAVSLGERDFETGAIACPVFSVRQQLVGSVSLGIPLFRFNKKAFDTCLPFVMEAGRKLTADLGGNPAIFSPPFEKLAGVRIPT